MKATLKQHETMDRWTGYLDDGTRVFVVLHDSYHNRNRMTFLQQVRTGGYTEPCTKEQEEAIWRWFSDREISRITARRMRRLADG